MPANPLVLDDPRVQAAAERVGRTTSQLIEEMAAAYYQKTGLPPDEVQLVQQLGKDGLVYWWFERRGAVPRG